MERSYGDVSLLQGASTPGIHTRSQEILPDFKVPLIGILSQLGKMPSKKKRQATLNSLS